jgi:hypothetical protein
MKAYSVDFREKIIQVYENEEISQRELSSRTKVIDTVLTFVKALAGVRSCIGTN